MIGRRSPVAGRSGPHPPASSPADGRGGADARDSLTPPLPSAGEEAGGWGPLRPATGDRRPVIGIFGGSFDPVHVGHLRMAEVAREAVGLDSVIFVPAQVSPFKTDRQVTPGELRLEMLRLATADNPAFSVSDAELHRPGPSYTVDTLRELARASPDAELHFLTGTDTVRDLPRWRDPEIVLSLARFVVATRPGVNQAEVLAALPDAWESRILFVEMPGLDISSSYLRAELAAGRSARYLLTDAVREFIKSKSLYKF